MALPTPQPIPVASPTQAQPTQAQPTPAQVLVRGKDAWQGEDVQTVTLNAQPSPPPKPSDPSLNKLASRHYQVTKAQVVDTNLKLPQGVKAYLHLGAVEVDLPAGTPTIKIYADGAYREVAHGDKVIVSLDDQIALLRMPYIKEVPDVQIGLTIN